MSKKRIVSLLPSCTEIVCALGCADQLVGRSHECDFPPEIQSLPVCTSARLDPAASSVEIDRQIKSLLQRALSIYEVDAARIEQLRPDLILTQDQCEVCAVSVADVRKALPDAPEILSVSPRRLADIWKDIQTIADAAGAVEKGRERISQLKNRVVDVIQKTCMIKKRPAVACVEWLDPLMAAGNWVPEIVDLAGGRELFGVAGAHSAWMEWEKFAQSDADVIVLMPCGFDLERTRRESSFLTNHPGWRNMRAVKSGNVFLADGNHYFNRPGPAHCGIHRNSSRDPPSKTHFLRPRKPRLVQIIATTFLAWHAGEKTEQSCSHDLSACRGAGIASGGPPRATHRTRLVAAAVGLSTTAWFLKVHGGSSQQAGGYLFQVLAVFLFVYAGLFGTQITADCMSEEKREGTLGLLFLTDLKGYDVVLGKLTASSLNFFYGMLAVVPVLAIPLLMGGVSQGEMIRVVLVLINLMFFSVCIGLWASAICRSDTRARGLAIAVALAILFAWPAAANLRRNPNPNPRLANLSSPAYACGLAFDSVYNLNDPVDFWINTFITQFYSWTFLGLACWITPRSWQDVVVGKSWWRRSRRVSYTRANRRRKQLELNPFLWRASRPEFKRVAVWIMLAVVAALWGWTSWYARGTWARNGFEAPVDFAFLIWGGLMVKVWIAAESGRAVGEDRRSGALELLLSTRLHPQEIVRGQQGALWRQFALPIAALLTANLFCLSLELRSVAAWDKDDRLLLVYLHVVLGAFLVFDSIALGWAGMWRGFIARKPNRSTFPAIFRIVLAPSLIFFLLVTLFSMSRAGIDGMALLLIWCVLGWFADLFAVFSREKLLAEFRAIASEGYRRRQPMAIRFERGPMLAEAK